jgi:steroid delta-isomerase-like uncharacterized protein
MSAEQYTNMIQRYFDALNTKNLDYLDEFYEENYVSHENPPRPDGVGDDKFKEFMTNLYSAYSDAHFTLEEMLVDGDTVVARWRFDGTHTGPSLNLNIPATGKKIVIIGCGIYHIRNGKVYDEWGYWDQSALLEQLGILPAV